MPQPDLPSPDQRARRRRRSRHHRPPFQEPLRYGGKRKRDRDMDDGGVPVEPNSPRGLSGGAAAALEFDD
jgi:hypothetical protein